MQMKKKIVHKQNLTMSDRKPNKLSYKTKNKIKKQQQQIILLYQLFLSGPKIITNNKFD